MDPLSYVDTRRLPRRPCTRYWLFGRGSESGCICLRYALVNDGAGRLSIIAAIRLNRNGIVVDGDG